MLLTLKHYNPIELVGGFSQLRSLPEAYFRIRSVLENASAGQADLVREISTDPALTARVLRAVNSPVYGQSRRVETLTRAVSILGTQAISDLVFATCIMDTVSTGDWQGLELRTYWRTALMTGLVSRSIGRTLADKDRLFIEGLLSQIGQLVLIDRIGKSALATAEHARRTKTPLQQVQMQFLGCHHAQVGAALLRRWMLPEPLCNAIERHLDQPAGSDVTDVCVLRLAAHLVSLPGKEISLTDDEPLFDNEQIHSMGLDAGDYVGLMERCREELRVVESSMLPASMITH